MNKRWIMTKSRKCPLAYHVILLTSCEPQLKLVYPRFLEFKCINNIDELVRSNVTEPPHLVMSRRAKWLKRWTVTRQNESSLQSDLEREAASVVWRDAGENWLPGTKVSFLTYAVAFALQVGFENSGCFVRLPKQPSMTVKHLLGMTRGLNQAVLSRSSATEDSDLVRASWEETLEELDKQWIWKDDSGNFQAYPLPTGLV